MLPHNSSEAGARALIVLVALLLAWHSWAHWGNFQIDCGRELYVPVQILHGKLLYRDLWFPHGPLASYVEASLVGVFGEHLYVFYLFGISLTITCALLLLQIGAILNERAAGLAAALLAICQGFEPSLFSYVFPYAYTAPLGLLLALFCLYFTIRDALGRSGRNLVLAGLAAAMAILCKQEMGVGCYILLAFALVTKAVIRHSAQALFRGIGECAPGVALWMTVYGWFFWKLTPGFILFDNWQFFPGSYFMRTYGMTYAAGLGLRFTHSELILLIFDGAAALSLWYGVAKLSARYAWRWPLAIAVLVLGAGMASVRRSALVRYAMAFVWALLVFPPGMFFIGCAFLICTLYKLYSYPNERQIFAEAIMTIFALVLSVRILAQVEPIGYGIYYDIPLFLVFVILISRCARMAVPSLQGKLVNSLLAAEVLMLALILVPLKNSRTARLDTTWGKIYLAPEEASVARQIIDFILEQKRKGEQVVVLPEGNMIYALTGTEAPSRWETIIPGVLSPSQEEDYIANLTRANAAYILLTNRKTGEYGAPYFGMDYDRKIYQWIEANYRIIGEFGRFRRDVSQGWAALLYQRRVWRGAASVSRLSIPSKHTIRGAAEVAGLQISVVRLNSREQLARAAELLKSPRKHTQRMCQSHLRRSIISDERPSESNFTSGV